MKKDVKKTRKFGTTILSIVLMFVAFVGLFAYIVPAYKDVKSLGTGLGDMTGEIVGKVLGSFDGITTGIEQGSKDGKEEGLSAKDTKSDIKNSFTEVGNLEVLEAGIKLKDVNTLGDDYAALFLLKGVAIYKIDLTDAEINETSSESIEVLLPDVLVDIYIDESATEKLAEYQKHSWSGSAQDGFQEYMNTRTAMDESVKETMENYDVLIKTAEDSAIKQVGILAKSATGNRKEITVKFKKEVQENE